MSFESYIQWIQNVVPSLLLKAIDNPNKWKIKTKAGKLNIFENEKTNILCVGGQRQTTANGQGNTKKLVKAELDR